MTAVYVLRHPQTTWNEAGRYQGRLEAPLSDAGRYQIALTARVFEGEPIAAVYTSPLSRASLLADAIAVASGAECIADNRLSEIAMGPWEGLEREEILQRFPGMFHQWYTRPDLVWFPHGESMADVMVRAGSVIDEIFRRYPDGNVCVVTHSAVVQALLMPALGIDVRYMHRLSVKNAGITTMCGTESPGRLQTFNAVDHLYGAAVESALALGCGTLEPRRRAS